MRLLFDEQLSNGLPAMLAVEHGCLLVTRDEDFHRLSVLRGAPPKVVWLRLGNCTTEAVAQLLRHHEPALRLFAGQDEATFLALG
jgi:predicted nuclease of predicted toxin-antitoxin system